MPASPPGTVVVTATRGDGTHVTVTLSYSAVSGVFAANAVTVTGSGTANVTAMAGVSARPFPTLTGGKITSAQLAIAGFTQIADFSGLVVTAG